MRPYVLEIKEKGSIFSSVGGVRSTSGECVDCGVYSILLLMGAKGT